MNKNTHETLNALNSLIELYKNIPYLDENFIEIDHDIDLLNSYIEYEIKKTLKDIIQIERL